MQAIARHGVDPPERQRVLRVLIAVCILPIVLLASCALYASLMPVHSASFHIADVRTAVDLELYRSWRAQVGDSGRTVRVRSPSGVRQHRLCGLEWDGGSQTRMYLTDQRSVAIEGNAECADFRSPELVVTRIRQPLSAGWQYLGAFQFVPGAGADHSTRQLRFIPSP